MRGITTSELVCDGCGSTAKNDAYILKIMKLGDILLKATPVILCPSCYGQLAAVVNKEFKKDVCHENTMVDNDWIEPSLRGYRDGGPIDITYSGERYRRVDIPDYCYGRIRDSDEMQR